jgi:hypothetical protein
MHSTWNITLLVRQFELSLDCTSQFNFIIYVVFILSVICLISISVSRKQKFQNAENNYVSSVRKSRTPHTAEHQQNYGYYRH